MRFIIIWSPEFVDKRNISLKYLFNCQFYTFTEYPLGYSLLTWKRAILSRNFR